jgi:sulfatase modifying factor 1
VKTWIQLATLLLCCLLAGRMASAEELRDGAGFTLRLLDAGRYERGEPESAPGFGKDHSDFNSAEDDRPVHAVVLTKPFYLATTEVTVAQFRKFVTATGYKTSAEQAERGASGWDPQPAPGLPKQYLGTFRDGGGFHWQNPGFPQLETHPVTCVSYADTQAYCQWLSQQEKAKYRLPTEAEWEYAARAGTTGWFSFGNTYRGEIHKHANIGNVELEKAFPERVRRQWLIDIARDPADQHVFTAPVGSYQPNPWGISDLYGNVWEWCEDRYLDTAYAAYQRGGYQTLRKRAIDPIQQEAGGDGDWRVIRGGSWFNAPIQCRSSVRGYFEAVDSASYLGFRVAREAPPEKIAAAQTRFERSQAAHATLERLTGGLRERRDGRLTVQLRMNLLTDELFTALADLDESVDVQLDGGGKLTGQDISALAKTKLLTGLSLGGTGPGLSDNDFAVLSQHPELEELQINGSPQLTNKLIGHFKLLTQLESLQLEGTAITDDGLQELPPLTKLKSLYLNGTASAGLVLQRCSGSPLERAGFSKLNDAGATLLGTFRSLRDISLSGSPISGLGLTSVASLPQLQRLELTGCTELADADFAVLGKCYDLRYVNFTKTAAGDKTLAGLVSLNNLTDTHLGSPQLTDAGVQQLCGIVSLTSFTIQPEAIEVTDAAFSDLWRLVNLTHLSIYAPRVTGTGLAALKELPKLESLGLYTKDVVDAGLEYVAQSRTLRQIQIGDQQQPSSTGVTINGIRTLSASRNIKQIDLIRRNPQITDAALDELRAQRRDLNISAR